MSLATPWTLPDLQKPGRGARIDWSSPLARGLILAPLFAEGAGSKAFDAAGRRIYTFSGASPYWAATPHGWAANFPGSNTYLSAGNLGTFPTRGTIAFWMIPASGATANNANPLSTHASSGNVGIRFETDPSAFVVVVANDAGAYTLSTYLASGVIVGKPYHVAYTWDTVANIEIGYLNGPEVFSNSNSNWPSQIADFAVGLGYNSSRYWYGQVDLPLIYTRVLPPSQITQLADPGTAYAMFERAIVRRWAGFTPSGSSPQTINLTGDGIASPAAFGSPAVTPGPVTISPSGIASPAAFGTATVSLGPVTISPTGIASPAAFGTPTVTPGPVTIYPPDPTGRGGLDGLRMVGTPTVAFSGVISPIGIASPAAFGVPLVAPGPVTLGAVGIASLAAFGVPIIFRKPTLPLRISVEGGRTVKVLSNTVRKVLVQ